MEGRWFVGEYLWQRRFGLVRKMNRHIADADSYHHNQNDQNPDDIGDEIVLTGEVPSPINPPSGCNFHPRCPFAMDRCSVEEPVLTEVGPGHLLSCHLYD